MDILTELKTLWLSNNSTALPVAGELLVTIRKYRTKLLVARLVYTFLSLGLMAIMIWVCIDYRSSLLSTRLGEIAMLAGIMFLLSMNIRSLKRSYVFNAYSNQAYLDFLQQEQTNHIKYQKGRQAAGFLLASAGLLLYMYEGVQDSIRVGILAYAGVCLWIVFCWFIVRPYSSRRKMQRLQERLATLKNLSAQLT